MLIALILLCVIAAAVIGSFVIPKRENYNRLDKLGFIFNIILSVLYIPISLFGIFSLFAADSMFMYPETIQKIIDLMITVGVSLPFLSVLGIALSVLFRRKGKSILSFIVQFVPLILFLIMVVTFEVVSHVQI